MRAEAGRLDLQEVKMGTKNSVRRLVACASFVLILSAGGMGYAEERAVQDRDIKKAGVSRYDEMARGVNAPIYDY